MLFNDRVRDDLEREVRGKEFDVCFRERLRREAALAPFENAGAFLAFVRETETRRAAKDAATVALLRAYAADEEARPRIGALLLLVLWPDIAGVVRAKTRQLSRKAGFQATDYDDLEQDLVLDLLARLPRFDPSRASLRTFVARLVDHHVATVLERRKAARRDWRRSRETVHDLVEDGCGALAPRWTTLDPRMCRERILGVEQVDEQGLRELRLDVRSAVEALAPELRRLADGLSVASPSEVARALGVPRSTLYDASRQIRGRLGRLGLDEYARGPASRVAIR